MAPETKIRKVEEGHNDVEREDAQKYNDILEKASVIEEELEKISQEYTREAAALVTKYEVLKKPHYRNRNSALSQIPKFWYTAITNHPMLSGIMEDEDLKALQYLTHLDVERDEKNSTSYKIIMTFRANPYFKNKDLVKQVVFSDDGKEESIKNTDILWHDGQKHLFIPDESESVAGASEGKRKARNEDSFFTFWNGSETDIADVIANDLFPNAILYYQGVEESEDDDDYSGEDMAEEEEVDTEEEGKR